MARIALYLFPSSWSVLESVLESKFSGKSMSKAINSILSDLSENFNLEDENKYPEAREKEICYRFVRASTIWEYAAIYTKIPQIPWLARKRTVECLERSGLQNWKEDIVLFYTLYPGELAWCCVEHHPNKVPPSALKKAIQKRLESLSEFYRSGMANFVKQHHVCSLEQIKLQDEKNEKLKRKDVSVPDDLKAKIEKIAQKNEVEISTFVRKIVELFLLQKTTSVERCEHISRERLLTFLAMYSYSAIETILGQTDKNHPDVVKPAQQKTFNLLCSRKEDHLLFYSVCTERMCTESAFRRVSKIIPLEEHFQYVDKCLATIENHSNYSFSGRLFE